MSQCVPNWDIDDGLPNPSAAATTAVNIHAPMSDYVVSGLTWEKARPSKEGFRGNTPRRPAKLPQKRPPAGGGNSSWEKHHASGTLEAVVDLATRAALVPAAAVDALVPSTKLHDQLDHLPPAHVVPDVVGVGTAAAGAAASGSTCGGRKRARAGAGAVGDAYSRSATGSAASAGLAFDACDINGDGGGEETAFATSTSPLDGSPETEHASCGRPLTAVSEEDDSCYSRRLPRKYLSDDEEKNGKEGSIPTKRIRVAAVHNQSERKRRDRINQRMRTLQKLVPNSSKSDKASILDEVIDYMRQLQAQVQMMGRMSSMPPMMMPMAMQQMQMAVMAQMAQMAHMGMAMGMGMPDMGQPGWPAAAAFLQPPASLPRDMVPGRDYPTQATAGAFPPDPFAAFMAFQTQQQMAMDARSRMAGVLCQQPQQPPPGTTNENQNGGNAV